MNAIALSVVVPCFNEEQVLPITLKKLLDEMDSLHESGFINTESRVLLVDDGSSDRTWELIEQASQNSKWVSGIKLARNVGHQNALFAGLCSATGDAVISIDADLQDDITVFKSLVKKYQQGAEIVYAARRERETDSAFKRTTAQFFYRFMRVLGVDVIHNHADYRLMGRRALENLKDFREVNLFLRGIVPLIGFNTDVVYYDRVERAAGESKYPLFRMLGLAINGITSFSVVPLRIIALTGIIFAFLSMGVGAWALFLRLFTDQSIPGWTSIVIPISAIGGIQLLSLGIVGEYVGKIYQEVKDRPRFIVEKETESS